MRRTGRIHAHRLEEHTGGGHQISFERGTGRATFNLRRPTTGGETRPVAAESFALEPEHYDELMRRVAAMRGDRG